MLVGVEGVGGLRVVGGVEHHGVGAEVGLAFLLLGVDFAVGAQDGLAVAALAVEAGVEHHREVLHRVGLEGVAEGVDAEALVGQAADLFFAQHDVEAAAVVFVGGVLLLTTTTLFPVEALDVVGVDAVGQQVGDAAQVGQPVAGVVDDEVGAGLRRLALAGHGLRELGQPVDAFLLDGGQRGVVEHFHLPLRHPEGVDKVLASNVAVVRGIGHIGDQRVLVTLVGDDEHIGVGVALAGAGDVVVHVVVLHPLGAHAGHRLAVHVDDAYLDGGAAVVVGIERVLVRLGHVAVIVARVLQRGVLLLEVGADGLGAEVGELAVVADARAAVDGDAEAFAVEHHGAVAELAVAAVIAHGGGELRAVGRRRDGDFHLLALLQVLGQRAVEELARQAADGAAGVRRVHVERAQRVVVRVAFEVLAVVVQAVDQVQPHQPVGEHGVHQVRLHADEALVVEFLVVRQGGEPLLGLALHLALLLQHHVGQRVAYLVLIAAVEGLLARLGGGLHEGGGKQRREE